MGLQDDGASVVDTDGKLWRLDNVYVAGNAIIGTSNAGNPTLMSVAQALRTMDRISGLSQTARNTDDAMFDD